MPQVAVVVWIALMDVGLSVAAANAVMFVLKFIATTAASMAASKLLAPKAPSYSDPSLTDRSQMIRSPIAARQIVYGQTKTSGVIVYISTTGTKNEYLHLVVALAGHEVEEIGDVYFNDELALTGAGSAAQGRFTGYAEIYKKLGSDTQTVETNLQTATASLTNGKWTSNHRLRGIAYIYVRLVWNQEVWTGGIPNISAVVKGKKVYDPRTTTTAYSANPALCLRDYLTSSLGMAMSSAEIDDTAVSAAANICDEDVEIKPVTSPATYENRYEANGVLYTSASPDENIGKLITAMGGLIAYSGGKVVVYAAGYRIPTVTLTEKHFAGQMTVQTKTSARDRVNGVKGVYVSPENDWQPSDFPQITSATYVTKDAGIRYWRDVALPFTTSPSCAQRLAVIELRRAREEITMTARFRLEAMQVRAGDTVMITNSKMGWTQKVFEVMEWNFASDGNPPQLAIEMTLRETASTVYDWTVADEIYVADAPNTTLPNPFTLSAPTNLTLTADGTTQQIQADGTALPRILVSWTAPAEEFIQAGGLVVIEYKESTSSTWLTWSRLEGTQTRDYISSDIKIGLTYNVRIYGISFFGVSTNYVSSSVTVVKDSTPPNTPTGGTITGEGVQAKYFPGTTIFLFGTRVGWAPNTQSDFAYYEIKATITNSDAATDYSWTPYDGANFFVTTRDTQCFLYANTLTNAGHVRIRTVNRSGTASSWAYLGNAASVGNSSFGTGTIAKYNDTDVTTTGIKTGAGSSTRQINVIFSDSVVVSLAGGATTEDFNVSLTNRGFGAKPDIGTAQCASNANLVAAYDFDAAGNSSTNAVVRVTTLDGTNVPAGNQRFSVEFTEYT
jgi:hypothetical protein